MKTIRRPFLTARWSDLAVLTYEVPPALLEPHLPAGLELDRTRGAVFASLVAFDVLDPRVWGVPWPSFRAFPEVNLGFYVKRGERRGVVFIREFVPRPAVAWFARAIYNEPYLVAPIDSRVAEESSAVVTARRLRWRGQTHAIEMTGSRPAVRPATDSPEQYVTDHQWRFGRDRRGSTSACEVRHPPWDVYPVRSWSVDVDWTQVYGAEWGFLAAAHPASVALAAGSAVSVYPRGRLT